MEKILRCLFHACVLSMVCMSCGESKYGGEDEPEFYYDLGAEEKANCYIVQNPGRYIFEADNQINLGEGLPVPPEISPAGARLLWQTSKDLISDVNLIYIQEKPYVSFDVKEPVGNALIAVYDSNGVIEWSWHIWMPACEVTSVTSDTGYEVMNLNLGAINNTPGDPDSYGFLYQWGRKDPFPASATLTGNTTTVGAPLYDINGESVAVSNSEWTSVENNTLSYSISHPTVCLSNYSQFAVSRDWLRASESDNTLWGNPNGDYKDADNTYVNKGRKTCYDPSPAGWRVAPADVFANFTSSGGYAWEFSDFNVADINKDGIVDLNDYNYGWHFMVNADIPLYFPAAARFDGSYAMLMGSMSGLWGTYWSNSPSSNMNGGALSTLAFQVKGLNGEDITTVSPVAAGSKADAYSIRCIRDN